MIDERENNIALAGAYQRHLRRLVNLTSSFPRVGSVPQFRHPHRVEVWSSGISQAKGGQRDRSVTIRSRPPKPPNPRRDDGRGEVSVGMTRGESRAWMTEERAVPG